MAPKYFSEETLTRDRQLLFWITAAPEKKQAHCKERFLKTEDVSAEYDLNCPASHHTQCS